MKHLYQDLVKYFLFNTFLTDEESNFEKNRFSGDQILRGRPTKGQNNEKVHEEVREFTAGGQVKIRFYFVSQCFSSYVKDSILKDIESQLIKPDLIIMNSCLWDLSQSNFDAMDLYKNGLEQLFKLFRETLPETPFFWVSTLPISKKSEGEMIEDFLRPILPGLIRDGNFHCFQICSKHKILYVDVYSTFIRLLHFRHSNGIYWKPVAVRLLTEILLNHIQSFYLGVKQFKCSKLRNDFEKKMKIYKTQLSSCSTSERSRHGLLATIAENVRKSFEKPLTTNKRKRKTDDERPSNSKLLKIDENSKETTFDLIVLSSDDDDEETTEILPIYLLNRRSLGIRSF